MYRDCSFETCMNGYQTSSCIWAVVSSSTWKGSLRWRSRWLRSHPWAQMRSLLGREEFMRQVGSNLELHFLKWGVGRWWLDLGPLSAGLGEVDEGVGWLSWEGHIAQRTDCWMSYLCRCWTHPDSECRPKERWELGTQVLQRCVDGRVSRWQHWMEEGGTYNPSHGGFVLFFYL